VCLLLLLLVTKQLTKIRGRKENSRTNFDTLNKTKTKKNWRFCFDSAEKRETKTTLLLLIVTAMDVDSDDDEEIIAERGTIAYSIIFLFFHARAYILLFLSSSHSTTTKGKAAIFERQRTTRGKIKF